MVGKMMFTLPPKPCIAQPAVVADVILLVDVNVPPNRCNDGACVRQKSKKSQRIPHKCRHDAKRDRVVPHYMPLAVDPFGLNQVTDVVAGVMPVRVIAIDGVDSVSVPQNSMEDRLDDSGRIIGARHHKEQRDGVQGAKCANRLELHLMRFGCEADGEGAFADIHHRGDAHDGFA